MGFPFIFRPGASYDIATGSAAASAPAAIPAGVQYVRLQSTQDCRVEFTGTASATSMFLPAGHVEYFLVTQGQTVSVIQDSTAGTLHVTELTR